MDWGFSCTSYSPVQPLKELVRLLETKIVLPSALTAMCCRFANDTVCPVASTSPACRCASAVNAPASSRR
ncbi:hypothetical protein D3C71_1845350 [compost metagenome]